MKIKNIDDKIREAAELLAGQRGGTEHDLAVKRFEAILRRVFIGKD